MLIQAQPVLGGDRVQVGLRADRSGQVPEARCPRGGQRAVQGGDPAGQGPQHRGAHPGQVPQRLVAVLPRAEVHLGHRGQADVVEHVDQDRDLDPVSGQEGDAEQQVPGGGELTGEGLHEPGEFGVEEVQQGLGHQLGHPAAAIGYGLLIAAEGAAVGRLAELDSRNGQQRADRAVDEVLAEITGVGVGEHDDIAARHRQGAPHRVALALGRPVSRQQFVFRINLGTMGPGDVRGAVPGVRVDHEHLIDQPAALVQPGHRIQDRADRAGHLAAWQDQRDGRTARRLTRTSQTAEIPVVKRPLLEPIPNGHIHGRPSFRTANFRR